MNFELNKIAGAVLGTCLFTMALGIATDLIYAQRKPAKPGYDLPVEEAAAAAPAANAAPAVPFNELLASASADRGKDLFKACATCHSPDKGGPNKVGPNLWGVIVRKKASHEGFNYSDGMKAKGGDWTFDELNAFIVNPKADVPGTKMAFAGEKDDAKRAAIVAYLRTLSDSPVPLPAK